MIETFTLEQLASPTSPLGSTITFSVSMKMGGTKSFSCPPFLYYALKAKALSQSGKVNEASLSEKDVQAIKFISKSIRSLAKEIYLDVASQDVDMERHMSTYLQDIFLSKLLNEPMGGYQLEAVKPAVQINAMRAKKNISIPYYLMRRLETLLGSSLSARSFIIKTAVDVRADLEKSGSLDEGKLIGDAANSSWSRKVHNLIMLHLVKMSPIATADFPVSIFDVKLVREKKRETRK